MKTQRQDRRVVRVRVEAERRVKPYVYLYEVKEIAELLNIPRQTLQEMINDQAADYREGDRHR